ncbi:MAG TPA: protein translocase subunit SecD, partial [Holophagaceae bacterium]|nr:protein translocase subunit SecD [Holophagaceae bacterium]
MSKRSLWRLLLTLAVCAGCAFFFLPLKKVRLGLDLQGGVHFELEVQGQEALEAHARDTRDRLEDKLKEAAVPGLTLKAEGAVVTAEGLQEAQRASFEKVIKEQVGGYDLKIEGAKATLTLKDWKAKEIKDDANKRALQIIENRINQFGVSEPEITASGAEGNRIVVELPGVEEGDRERIKGLLSSPGRLELRLTSPMKQPGGRFMTREAGLEFYKGQLPAGYELLPEMESDRVARQAGHAKPAKGEERIAQWWLVQTRVDVNGTQITDARRSSNDLGAHTVSFQLNRDGADAFATATGTAAADERYLAIVLDRKVISAPTVHEKIIGGSVQITGSFTADEADDLSLSLRSGAMRASMKFLEEHAVGASLGEDSIKSGVFAATLGFLTILVFMVFFYHWSGMNAIIALTVNVIVMMGLLGSFRAVITLPGIAGFALTVGMAVDANILIFERIKEELDAGRSVSMAIDAGFDRVFWTIVDSHVTQLAAALLLFIFGTGPVKGFAVSLTVGVVASLFTSIYISRFIYDWVLERHPDAKEISIGKFRIFHGTTVDFMRYKNVALAISWGIIMVCLVAARPWKGGG